MALILILLTPKLHYNAKYGRIRSQTTKSAPAANLQKDFFAPAIIPENETFALLLGTDFFIIEAQPWYVKNDADVFTQEATH
jgi:hypothetical protein